MKPWMQCVVFVTTVWTGAHWAAAQTPEAVPQPVEAVQTQVADTVQPEQPRAKRSPGDATRALLQAQAQGSSASTLQYPMSGAVAQKAFERYVNSFSHPIPEQSASAIAKSSK